MSTKTINNSLWLLVSLVATGSVGMLWSYVVPTVSAHSSDLRTLTEEARYIRERVDEIHSAVGAQTRSPPPAQPIQ